MSFAFLPTEAEMISWAISASIVAGFVALAFLSRLILSLTIRVIAHRTKTTLDDLIIKSLTAPVFIIIIAAGIWIALSRVIELDSYQATIHQVFVILYITIAAIALIRIIHAVLNWYSVEMAGRTKSEVDDRLIPVLRRIVDIPIYGIALMIILDELHINISPILAGLGIGGLAVALALQPTLSNFLAGTYVISDAVIHKGHYIMLDSGQEGTVEDIGWRTTKIRHWQGNLIVLPNSKLADAIVTDYEKPEASMLFTVDCYVGYDSDLAKVELISLEIARELLRTNPLGSKDFEPVLRFNHFGDSNIEFTVILKGIDRVAQFTLKHEFIKALHKRFQEEKIEIQYPTRKLYFANNVSGLFDEALQKQSQTSNRQNPDNGEESSG
jgi:small-conductance mechanosensitive channel